MCYLAEPIPKDTVTITLTEHERNLVVLGLAELANKVLFDKANKDKDDQYKAIHNIQHKIMIAQENWTF